MATNKNKLMIINFVVRMASQLHTKHMKGSKNEPVNLDLIWKILLPLKVNNQLEMSNYVLRVRDNNLYTLLSHMYTVFKGGLKNFDKVKKKFTFSQWGCSSTRMCKEHTVFFTS